MRSSKFLVASLLLVVACGHDGHGTNTDASPGDVDAPNGTTDAPNGTADAPNGTADAPNGTADAPSTSADGSIRSVDAATALADAPHASADGSQASALCHVSGDNLRLCIDFEDLSVSNSAVTDASGTIAAGDITGSNLMLDTRPVGNALESAAAINQTSIITIAKTSALDFTSEVTVEMWFNATALPTSGKRMGLFDNNNQYSMFLHDNGVIDCTFNDASSNGYVSTATPSVSTGQWHHIACQADSSHVTLFLDGAQVDQAAFNDDISTAGTVGSCIGADCKSNGSYADQFVGSIDNVRIWSTALAQTDICSAAGIAPCP